MSEMSLDIKPAESVPGDVADGPLKTPPKDRIRHAADVRGFAPPLVSDPHWAATNRLLADRGALRLTVDAKTVAFGLAARRPVPADLTWLGATIAGHAANIGIPNAVLGKLMDGLIPGAGAEPELTALLIEAVLAPWIEAFETRSAGCGVLLSGASVLPAPDWFEATLRIDMQGWPKPLAFPVSLSSGAVQHLSGALDQIGKPVRHRQLPIAGTVSLGPIPAKLDALRALVPGDVLVVGEAATPRPVTVSVLNRYVASGRLEANKVRLTAPLTRTTSHKPKGPDMATDTMTAEETVADPVESPAAVEASEALPAPDASTGSEALPMPEDSGGLVEEDVTLPIDIDLGSVDLRLADLDGLAEGQVLDLSPQSGDRVVLRSAGYPIAQGELVDLGGPLGVRITRVAKSIRRPVSTPAAAGTDASRPDQNG